MPYCILNADAAGSVSAGYILALLALLVLPALLLLLLNTVLLLCLFAA